MTVICLGSIQSSQAAQSGEQVFQSLCTACHTIGKGKLVGPDLAGVTSRREASWLVRQIQEPDSLIAENDPIAMQLLQEANGVPMVRLGLTDAQVSAVVSYLQSIEQQAVVASGLPSQYVPTVIISVVLLIVLTLIGLIVGRKKVEVR
jgi:mono/diheme cytochrome c family protein|tara:strand:- start:121 stop:564 length:444 start_codon:yes stop_codon:yes gene_type:complete